MNKYAMIVALDSNNGFSKNNTIPWHYPEDFQHFRKLTTSYPCVMGRNTYVEIDQKLGHKQPNVLPNRPCYLISKTVNQSDFDNVTVIPSYEFKDLEFFVDNDSKVFFIGGEQIFYYALQYVDTIYLTRIQRDYGCDQVLDMDYIWDNFKLDHIEQKGGDPDLLFLTYIRDK